MQVVKEDCLTHGDGDIKFLRNVAKKLPIDRALIKKKN